MRTGIWANFNWENRYWDLVAGNGNHRTKNNRTGTGILNIWENNRLRNGKMGFIPPLPPNSAGPSTNGVNWTTSIFDAWTKFSPWSLSDPFKSV